MKTMDAVVIGGGVLGCFAARNLRRWRISAALLEAKEDVCRGITRANTAIVYAGYDNKPGSRKAQMTVRANASYEKLCRELEVPFSRCGSLMASFGEKGDSMLRRKLEQGRRSGVPGLSLLSGAEARKIEPFLSEAVTLALYSPVTGTVNPWQLGIAAFENAVQNGVIPKLNTKVLEIRQVKKGYLVKTQWETFACRVVINCAGMYADKVQELLFPPKIRLRLDGADFLVLDRHAPGPSHIIFQEGEDGKGITAVPCVEGNLLLDSPPRPMKIPFAATREGMDFIKKAAADVLPAVDLSQTIRSFGAVRANPYMEDGRNISDFCVENPAPGFFSLIGIKTPGLTCADELGRYLAKECAAYLDAPENPDFNPFRRAVRHTEDPQILCQCGQVTRQEVLEAIRRGAVTADGVKRRVGTGMGHCQGSRCTYAIERLLEECRDGKL